MKKYIIAILVIIAAVFFAQKYFGEKRVLRIGVECDYAPNNWLETIATESNAPIANEPGHYAEGYDIQIAKLVAEELNAELEVKRIEWNDLLDALNRGEIDAIFSGMLDTGERKEKATFSDVYDVVKTEYTIVVNTSSNYNNANTLEDFSGARLVAQKGTNLDTAINQIPGAVHLPPVDTVTEMLNEVINKRADGTVINYDTGQTYEKKHHNLKLIRFPEGKGFHIDFSGICAGVRKSDTKLLKDINDALSSISRNDRRKIMDRTIARAFKVLP